MVSMSDAVLHRIYVHFSLQFQVISHKERTKNIVKVSISKSNFESNLTIVHIERLQDLRQTFRLGRSAVFGKAC